MTKRDAEKVAAIAITADGGCPNCVIPLLTALANAFPAYDWRELGLKAKEADMWGGGVSDSWRQRFARVPARKDGGQ